jgi:hypothetical protein
VRPQFSLRGLFAVLGLAGLAFAFLRWQGPSIRSAVHLFLLAVIPAAAIVERVFTSNRAEKSRASRPSMLTGLLGLLVASLVPSAAAAAWILVLWFDQIRSFPLLLLICATTSSISEFSYWQPCMLAVAAFVIGNFYLVTHGSLLPMPLRLPILMAVFTALCIAYCACDSPQAIEENGLPLVAGFMLANVTMVAILWALWWWRRNTARRWQVLALSALFYAWMFGLAFPILSGLLVEEFFQLNMDLTGMFDAGAAPEVNKAGWAQMRVGLTKAEVEALLGGHGYPSGGGTVQFDSGPPQAIPETWEYEWHGGGFLGHTIDDRAYVVYFDENGRVSGFRGPLDAEESPAPGELIAQLKLPESDRLTKDRAFRSVALRMPWAYGSSE